MTRLPVIRARLPPLMRPTRSGLPPAWTLVPPRRNSSEPVVGPSVRDQSARNHARGDGDYVGHVADSSADSRVDLVDRQEWDRPFLSRSLTPWPALIVDGTAPAGKQVATLPRRHFSITQGRPKRPDRRPKATAASLVECRPKASVLRKSPGGNASARLLAEALRPELERSGLDLSGFNLFTRTR